MHWFAMQPRAALMAGALFGLCDLPLFYIALRVIFPGKGDFLEALAYWLKPDLYSIVRGEGWEDFWAEMKLGVLFSALSGALALEGYILVQHFGLIPPVVFQ